MTIPTEAGIYSAVDGIGTDASEKVSCCARSISTIPHPLARELLFPKGALEGRMCFAVDGCVTRAVCVMNDDPYREKSSGY